MERKVPKKKKQEKNKKRKKKPLLISCEEAEDVLRALLIRGPLEGEKREKTGSREFPINGGRVERVVRLKLDIPGTDEVFFLPWHSENKESDVFLGFWISWIYSEDKCEGCLS